MACIVVSLFSLCGVPFIRGFYSKDCIIENGLLCGQSLVFYLILVVGLLRTYYYCIRMAYRVMCGVNKGAISVVKSGESSVVKLSYACLLVSAVLIGYLLVELMDGFSLPLEARLLDKAIVLLLYLVAYFLYLAITLNKSG